MPQADEPGLRRACETLPNPTEPHGTPERRSLLPRAARRAAPRQHAALLLACTWEAPAPAARHPHSSHQRATPRVYHLRKTGGWRRPHSRPSEGSSCAAVAAARAALVPGGEARTTASDREARRGARRAESPSDDRVRRCGAPSSTEQRSRRGDRTVRGARAARGRRADEPAAREEERGRGVRKQGAEARRCGVLEPRAEAPGRESTRRLS